MLSFFKISAIALLGLLMACGSPEYFLLPPPQVTVTRLASPVKTISVSEISLPSYAEAIEIATLSETGSVELAGKASWADTPRRGLTRHLVASLESRLNAKVGAEPWPGFDRPVLRIDVVADRLVGTQGGVVEFSGQYIIVAPESGNIFASERFAIRVSGQTEGYAGLATAHARAIEQLADDIAARISGTKRPTS